MKKYKINDISFLKFSLFILIIIVFCLIFFLGGGVLYFEKVRYVDSFKFYDFQIHVINVGQGDAILIKLPDNHTLLIDTGEEKSSNILKKYINQFLKTENLNCIDYLILTHLDSDHIGGAEVILNNFNVKSLYRPPIYSVYENENFDLKQDYSIVDSQIYSNIIQLTYEQNCDLIFFQKDLKIKNEFCKIKFLSPSNYNYSESNNFSAVIQIEFQNKRFLFMGDAEEIIEQQLIKDYGESLQSDVIKIAHHGSKTSTSQEFLNIVQPNIALLSVGENNYGLPSIDVLNRLNNLNINILSTYDDGSFALTVLNDEVIFAVEPVPSCDMAIVLTFFVLLMLVIFKANFQKTQNNQNIKNH